jgi:hypothetical protein
MRGLASSESRLFLPRCLRFPSPPHARALADRVFYGMLEVYANMDANRSTAKRGR